MWQSQIQSISTDSIQKIRIFQNDRPITYGDILQLWQYNQKFCDFFANLLAQVPFKAYFWETPPINLSKIDLLFEFVVIDSPQLAIANSEPKVFAEYFAAANSNQQIVTFPNLNRDAFLVVPSPIADISIYPHLASFVRKAPMTQQHALWQTLGKTIEQRLNDRLIWVSTSGLGVYWLHIRLDSLPKYYNFQPYL
jgi:hypothetical protein